MYNGGRGAQTVTLSINGTPLTIDRLRDRQVTTRDISALLRSGNNTASATVQASRSGSADVLLWDGAGAAPPERSSGGDDDEDGEEDGDEGGGRR